MLVGHSKEDQDPSDHGIWEGADPNDYEHIGVEPMLLALAMELALKAWLIFDHDNTKMPKTHDLAALFERLLSESQERLDARSVGVTWSLLFE